MHVKKYHLWRKQSGRGRRLDEEKEKEYEMQEEEEDKGEEEEDEHLGKDDGKRQISTEREK